MSGGKGGTQSAQVEFPYYAEGAARDLVKKGKIAADMPYAPYSGPDVAAFTPAQVAAMQSTGKAAEAYGIIGRGQTPLIVGDPKAGPTFRGGFMDATDYGGGIRGHSSLPLFQQSVANLETIAPNYMDMYRQLYPISGDSEQLPYYYPEDYEGQIYRQTPSIFSEDDYMKYFMRNYQNGFLQG